VAPTGEAKAFGPAVDGEWLRDHLDDPGLVIADVRWYLDDRSGRHAYDAGHVPGAVFVDLDTDLAGPPSFTGGRHPLPDPVEFSRTMSRLGIGDTHRVVAYDDVGGAIAARMWWMLDVMDVPAAILDGGIGAWEGQLSTDATEPVRSCFTTRPWPVDRVVTADQIGPTSGSDALVLDARDAERYAHGSAIDPRPGHVPGARNAPFADNLEGGHLKSASELRVRYEALGAGSRPVVAYCGSGVTACHDLLAMRRAGLGNGLLFVGSWSAWGADADLPAETGPDEGPGPAGDVADGPDSGGRH